MGNKYNKNEKKIISKYFIWIIPLFLSIIFFLINKYNKSILLEFINDNLLIQTIMFFLSIVSLVSLFSPISFRRELNYGEIKNIYSEKINEISEYEKEIEWIEKEASF